MTKPSGGLKGLLQTTGKTIFSAGVIVRDFGTIAARWGYKIGGNVAFVMATTSMIVLMPLIFESTREVQVCSQFQHLSPLSTNTLPCTIESNGTFEIYQMLENERMQVKELKNRGYSPRQLQEMGYSESALHTPALALAKKY